MRSIYNEEKHKNDWVVEKWYEKVYFVFGLIYTWIVILAALVGFVKAIWE